MMEMSKMRMSPVMKPDKLLVALVFDKYSRMHVGTLVGGYSELLPNVDLLDDKLKDSVVINREYLYFCLNNCLSSKKSFLKEAEKYFRTYGFQANLVEVFKQIRNLLWLYSQKTGYNKPLHRGASAIRTEAIVLRQKINDRERDSNIKSFSSLVPIVQPNLDSYLSSMVRYS
jgi:hypothetical protein